MGMHVDNQGPLSLSSIQEAFAHLTKEQDLAQSAAKTTKNEVVPTVNATPVSSDYHQLMHVVRLHLNGSAVREDITAIKDMLLRKYFSSMPESDIYLVSQL